VSAIRILSLCALDETELFFERSKDDSVGLGKTALCFDLLEVFDLCLERCRVFAGEVFELVVLPFSF